MISIRTLSPQDAEILARTIETGVSSDGHVTCHLLKWRSDSLKTWEIEQRSLGRKPEVSIRIDELDLSVVYVDTLHGEKSTKRAKSTMPEYTKNLSLWEHNRLRALIKKKNLEDHITSQEDPEAFQLRLEFHALLGKANDPVAYRRLVALNDQLAAKRGGAAKATAAAEPMPAPSDTSDPKKARRRKHKKLEAEPIKSPATDPEEPTEPFSAPAPTETNVTPDTGTPSQNTDEDAAESTDRHFSIKRIPR